jgi:hypothetical protein
MDKYNTPPNRLFQRFVQHPRQAVAGFLDLGAD